MDAASHLVAQALATWGQCLSLSWQAWLDWPQAAAALQAQVWDHWTAHWGGGIPLDG